MTGEPSEPTSKRDPVKLRREKRRGKAVIVIEDLPSDLSPAAYAKALKEKCATGGTVKGETIEIQGDHREVIERYFRELGFRTKRTGG